MSCAGGAVDFGGIAEWMGGRILVGSRVPKATRPAAADQISVLLRSGIPRRLRPSVVASCQEEYEGKIRGMNLRMDGMAIAAQWVSGLSSQTRAGVYARWSERAKRK